MEGKALLFKRFAGLDSIDIEVKHRTPEEFVNTVANIADTFGGINLEDIKAPECFEIEKELKQRCSIPVFHDDQHGTAIISGAALINAVELQGKKLEEVTVVFSGAGAAAVSCARHYIQLGVKAENITVCDSKGAIYKGRADIAGTYKEEFAIETDARSLEDAMIDADCFAGLSRGGIVSQDMVKAMAEKPVIFAMANPDPEITYNDVKEVCPDAIMATGRSDYPNQVNNVLGFPFIFRGALDVEATDINEPMKVAATHALAKLAKAGDIPQEVLDGYGVDSLEFGEEYIIPKPLDPRVLVEESFAVAKAAVESGVAKSPKSDWNAYYQELTELSKTIQG